MGLGFVGFRGLGLSRVYGLWLSYWFRAQARVTVYGLGKGLGPGFRVQGCMSTCVGTWVAP